MIRFDKADDPRRRLLIRGLAAGFFGAITPGRGVLAADPVGTGGSKLPAGRSIYRMSGEVLVNGIPATLETRIFAGDTVETMKGAEIVFVVGGSSMMLRSGSRVELKAEQKGSVIITGLEMLVGSLLSVSRDRSMQIKTHTSVLGIRGTGFYVEADPQQTYFCVCYGVADIAASADTESRTTVVARQHDNPVYIVAGAPPGQNIRPAPLINHTDQELMLIESLVGRTPPFVFPTEIYNAPRRGYN